MRAMSWAGPADLMSLIRTDEMGRGAFKACRERERGSRMEQRRLLSCISLCVPLDFSHRFYTPPFVSLSTVSTALQEPQALKLDPRACSIGDRVHLLAQLLAQAGSFVSPSRDCLLGPAHAGGRFAR